MTRAVLAVMAGLLCALAGMKHAAALKSDAARMQRWVQLLHHLTLLLREGTMSIPEALCAAADRSAPADRVLQGMAGCMAASPLCAPDEAYRQCRVDGPEKDLLLRLFTRLGHGSLENRCLAVEQAADEMALLAQNAAAKAEKDAKLWQTLGLIGGGCLTILMI